MSMSKGDLAQESLATPEELERFGAVGVIAPGPEGDFTWIWFIGQSWDLAWHEANPGVPRARARGPGRRPGRG